MSDQVQNQVIITWDELLRDARNLARQLSDQREWNCIAAVTRGGMIPAALVARELDIRFIDTVSVESYAGMGDIGNVRILKSCGDDTPRDGEGWLVIDDLVDSGRTFRKIRTIMPKSTYACLYAKPLGKDSTDLFVRDFDQEEWIHFPWEIEHTHSKPIRGEG